MLLFVLEKLVPARTQPHVRLWLPRAAVLNVLPLPFMLAAGITWEPWLRAHHVFDLSDLPPALAGLLGLLAFQFVFYFWHRTRHDNNFLWRTLHQMHHSPQRQEVLAAYYSHPLDFVFNLLLSGSVLYGLLGLTVEAVAWYALYQGAHDYFAHANLRTPYWIGYFIQRPEMHRIHHEIDVHKNNYALPVYDMLFGTYENPRTRDVLCGFENDKELFVGPMLIGENVHQPEYKPCCSFAK